MALTQLIYTSTAAREYDARELRTILDSAMRRNAQNSVTGMLMYSQGTFMQVLEGDDAAIDETMRRISLDKRHHSVFELSRETINEREFGRWSMGFYSLDGEDALISDEHAHRFDRGFNPQVLAAKEGMALEVLRAYAQKAH
jgi:Arc/MetJ family transcription regulator